jgi:hypothetical protein
MTEGENVASTDVSQQNPGQDPVQRRGPAGSPLDDTAMKVEELIKAFSQSASQITGRIISLIGLALVVTTFMLGIVHLLGSEDFVASIISGAALSIAGIAMITADDIRVQRAVAALLGKPAADAFMRGTGEH